MQIKSVARASAIISSLALLALSGSPAMAAEPVAQASATGITLAIANNPVSTGTYKVVNDGNSEAVTGSNQPPLSLLGNQNFISVGTVAQNATTAIVNGDGTSAACAGVAGQGASLVAAGQGNCLAGGNALNLTTAALDLDNLLNVTLVNGQTFTSLQSVLDAANLAGLTTPLVNALQTGLDQALAPLAGAGLVVGAGAIQSSCTATPTTADGTANIANAGAFVQLPAFAGQPAQRINLLNFPASPPPNTNVLVNLDAVTATIINGVQTSLNTTASGALQPLSALLGPLGLTLQQVQTQLVTNVVAQLQPLLQPLNQNVLQGTLNKQVRPATNSIEVTALELKVLPALQQQLGYSLLETAIGKSTCGPNGRVAAVAPAATQAPAPNNNNNNNNPGNPNNNPGNPQVPTSVPAGLADGPLQNAPLGPWALAGLGVLLVASAGAGTAAYRRSNARI